VSVGLECCPHARTQRERERERNGERDGERQTDGWREVEHTAGRLCFRSIYLGIAHTVSTRNLRTKCFREFQIVLVLVAGKGVCQRYPAGILIYMTMKSMILFMINYHKPEVKHEIARARLLYILILGWGGSLSDHEILYRI